MVIPRSNAKWPPAARIFLHFTIWITFGTSNTRCSINIYFRDPWTSFKTFKPATVWRTTSLGPNPPWIPDLFNWIYKFCNSQKSLDIKMKLCYHIRIKQSTNNWNNTIWICLNIFIFVITTHLNENDLIRFNILILKPRFNVNWKKRVNFMENQTLGSTVSK